MSQAVGETRNRPYPPKIRVWGKNMFVGKVIPNTEFKTNGGIIIADANSTQFVPCACEIVSVSSVIDPAYAADLKVGNCVYYQVNSGYNFPQQMWGEDFVLLDARSCVGV